MSNYQARITKTADGSFYALIVRIDRDGEVRKVGGLGADALDDHAREFGVGAGGVDEDGSAAVAGIDVGVDEKAAMGLGGAEGIGGDPAAAQQGEGAVCAGEDFRIAEKGDFLSDVEGFAIA